MGVMRTQQEFDHVRFLISKGENDCEIARKTGIPRTTIRDWRRTTAESPRRARRESDEHERQLHSIPVRPYCYLLGLYLGDGYINRSARVWRLRVTLDSRYPQIIADCCRAMEDLMIGQHAYTLARGGCVDVSMYSKRWPSLFPQLGPGRKHERDIRLETWQQTLVNRDTEGFIRGLIHSDGCRVVANDRGVRSVRYHFSNRSDDIIGLYCAALDTLGIPWTRPSAHDVAVYRKKAVARLDEFVGPKR